LQAAVGGRTGTTRSGIAPITAHANVGDDDPTDTNLAAPKPGFLGRIRSLFQRKAKPKAAAAYGQAKLGQKKSGKAGLRPSARRLGTAFGIIGVLGAAAAAYFFFFSSPIPSDLDVIPDHMDSLRAVVKLPVAQGKKLFLAEAKGTLDDPADPTSPKFYVATNAPEGTEVKIHVVGKPGTLVNRINFELAVFERVDDGGKPIPMGYYKMTVTADGAEPLSFDDYFLGGRKGGVYQSRLGKYKEKLQGDYDKEMQELRETIDTLKNLQAEVSKRIADYKANLRSGPARARVAGDWRGFVGGAQVMATQLDTRLKSRLAAADATYYPRAFQDAAATLAQLQQLMDLQSKRLAGDASANPDNLEGLAQAGVISLEQVLSQALVRSPIDVLLSPRNQAAPASTATPVKAPASQPPAAP
jgi:hypothetical protein